MRAISDRERSGIQTRPSGPTTPSTGREPASTGVLATTLFVAVEMRMTSFSGVADTQTSCSVEASHVGAAVAVSTLVKALVRGSIRKIFEHGVVLSLTSDEAERLPEPSENPGVLEVTGVEDVDRTELGEKLRRAWEIISGEGSEKR